jgi:pimeloyl-ACP methyl ester carboxylesterase
VIAGHSIAGEELSYIGSAHPDKVAGLIYLDAGYPYAMYDEVNGNFTIDVVALQQQLALVLPGSNTAPADQKKVLDDLSAKLQRVSAEVAETRSDAEKMPSPPQGGKMPPIGAAILGGQQRFTTVSAPALAIYALPHNLGPLLKDNPQARAAFQSINDRNTTRQATAFERQVPSAHVVRLSNATHFIFFSNEADVLREMNGFIAALPAAN